MKTVAAFVVVLLTAVVGSAQAAEITYEHAFAFTGESFYPGSPGDPTRVHHGLPSPSDSWTVPTFDFSLGILELLQIEIEGTASISGRVHNLGGLPLVGLFANATIETIDGQVGILNGSRDCTEPCNFFFAPMNEEGQPTEFSVVSWVFSDTGPFPVTTVPFAFGTDTFVTYEISATTTMRTSLTGIARATYIYEPFAEPIPEPTTLLLLGSGLIAARVRRSRRR